MKMASCPYSIVKFLVSNTVAIVPVSWLSVEEDECSWPPKGSSAYSKVTTMIKNLEKSHGSWEKHEIEVLGKASMCAHFLMFLYDIH